jgi:MinD superfamily P-loop ATPase
MNKACGVIINRSGIGNNGVQKYLKQEGIPILLEVPFDKEISELYSKGLITAEKKPFLAEALYEMVKKIISENGNSDNQR